jgi:pimeloyl-ACP methyl ester carboxylesterase
MKKLFLLLQVFLAAMLNAADYAPIPEGWSDGYAYSNSVRIHFYHAKPAPTKPVVVMVHGVTDNGLCWTTLALKMQDAFDIYMLDARGHGLSDPFTLQDDGETLVKDVVGFISKMNFKKPILIGHSMGAATVMRVGAEYPDLSKAIIMLDPFISNAGFVNRNSAPSKPVENKKKPDDISINMFGDPETLVKQNNYSFEDLINLCKKQNPKWDKVDAMYWALSKKQYHGPYFQEASASMSSTMNTGNSLSKIVVPSLILKADASPESRKANENSVKDFKLIKLIHIDGAAHNLHHDDLQRTYKEIMDFLKI